MCFSEQGLFRDFPKEIVNCPRNLPKVMVVLKMIKQNGREAIKDRLWGKEGKNRSGPFN